MRIKNNYQKLLVFLIWVVVCIVNIFRFYNLEDVPYGLHVDELSSAVTVQCVATEGKDALGNEWPLFSHLNYGSPCPPTYIYPGVLWTKIFGFSIASFHGFSAFGQTLSIIGLFFLARAFFFLFFDPNNNSILSKERSFLFSSLTVLVASISPWMWIFSRIAYESAFSVIFLIWGLYFLFKDESPFSMGIAGFLFSCAAYSYPSTRAQLPFMLIFSIIFMHSRRKISFKNLVVLSLSLIIFSLPIVTGVLDGSLQGRFNEITILSKGFLLSQGKEGNFFDILGIFFRNFFLHFDPEFLFLRGARNYMHSTQFCGILSWVDILSLGLGSIGVVFYMTYKERSKSFLLGGGLFIFFCFCNILIGIIPAALTHEGLPHPLRTIGSWPFLMLLSGFLLYKFIEKFSQALIIVVVVSCIFISLYLKHYFTIYPRMSRGMFSFWSKQEALAAKTDKDWLKFLVRHSGQNFHVIYYFMNYKKDETCTSARTKWEAVYNYMRAQGKR